LAPGKLAELTGALHDMFLVAAGTAVLALLVMLLAPRGAWLHDA